MEPLKAELLGDNTVQAVCFLDFAKNTGGFVRRNDSIPVPGSEAEVNKLLTSDPNSYRRSFYWGKKSDGSVRGVIYVDLSRPALRRHFWEADGSLIKKVGALTCIAFLIVSGVGILAYRLWGSAERQRLRAQLEQQGLLAERGLTAAVLAHEIRNPLQALRYQLYTLRKNASDPQRVGSTSDMIDSELSRIGQLVQDYLVHERAQTFRVEAVELGEAARNLHTLMAGLLKENGTRLVVNCPEKVIATCDPHALRQVLMNLVINAQQAMGRGGLITITIGKSDGFASLAVKDTGPGIPDAMKEHLFKPFATSKKEGSGIGLALVKRFVDNFGGSVGVESEPGKGALFTLRLPLAGGVNEGVVIPYQRPIEA
jgi:signal transduction histidine kinase